MKFYIVFLFGCINSACLSPETLKQLGWSPLSSPKQISNPSICKNIYNESKTCVDQEQFSSFMENFQKDLNEKRKMAYEELNNRVESISEKLILFKEKLVEKKTYKDKPLNEIGMSRLEEALKWVPENPKEFAEKQKVHTKDCIRAQNQISLGTFCILSSEQASNYVIQQASTDSGNEQVKESSPPTETTTNETTTNETTTNETTTNDTTTNDTSNKTTNDDTTNNDTSNDETTSNTTTNETTNNDTTTNDTSNNTTTNDTSNNTTTNDTSTNNTTTNDETSNNTTTNDETTNNTTTNVRRLETDNTGTTLSSPITFKVNQNTANFINTKCSEFLRGSCLYKKANEALTSLEGVAAEITTGCYPELLSCESNPTSCSIKAKNYSLQHFFKPFSDNFLNEVEIRNSDSILIGEVGTLWDKTKNKAGSITDSVTDKAGDLADKTGDLFGDLKDKVQNKISRRLSSLDNRVSFILRKLSENKENEVSFYVTSDGADCVSKGAAAGVTISSSKGIFELFAVLIVMMF